MNILKNFTIFGIMLGIVLECNASGDIKFGERDIINYSDDVLDLSKVLDENQVSNIVGFGNQRVYIFDKKSSLNFNYNIEYNDMSIDEQSFLGKGRFELACVSYESNTVDWTKLELTSNEKDKADVAHIFGEVVVSALCGNADGEIKNPEVLVLTRDGDKLRLRISKLKSEGNPENWETVWTSNKVSEGRYYLVPVFKNHSSISFKIIKYHGEHVEIVDEIFPRKFSKSFKYKPEDHGEIWMEYLNLDRASAKLMWFSGIKSIGKLERYLHSIDQDYINNPGLHEEGINRTLYNLDPNEDKKVSERLTHIYIDWKN